MSERPSSDTSVIDYERALAASLAVQHVVTFAFARHALVALLVSLDLEPGDEVLLSPLTCKIVPLTLLALDLIPVYVDISPDSLNIDPSSLEKRIGARVKAVVFQHTYGNSAGLHEVAEVVRQRKVVLLEDCAQVMPSSKGSSAATRFGEGAIFSNNLRKPLAAASGGVAAIHRASLADRVREIQQGLPRRGLLAEAALILESLAHKHLLNPQSYWALFSLSQSVRGFYRQTDLSSEIRSQITRTGFRISSRQAREGLEWLGRVEQLVEHRREACNHYRRALERVPGVEVPGSISEEALYYFPVCVGNKSGLLSQAKQAKIEIAAWPVRTPIYPIEDEALLGRYGYNSGECVEAERIARRLVGLPTDPSTDRRQREAVIDLVQRCRWDG